MMKSSVTFRQISSLHKMANIKNNTVRIMKCKNSGHSYDIESDSGLIKAAADQVNKHQLIAVPTDTIYGVACKAQSSQAINSLYELKKRDRMKPVAICVAHIADIPRWAKVTLSTRLMSLLLPGPVTLLFERTSELSQHINPGEQLVGVRIPDYDLIRQIVETVGEPVALTSANISSEPSSLEIKEFESLWPSLSLIVDGGKLNTSKQARLGSTVVDVSVPGQFQIIRAGSALEATRKKLCQFDLVEISNNFK